MKRFLHSSERTLDNNESPFFAELETRFYPEDFTGNLGLLIEELNPELMDESEESGVFEAMQFLKDLYNIAVKYV